LHQLQDGSVEQEGLAAVIAHIENVVAELRNQPSNSN